MPVEQQPPEALALLIADHVHRDDLTGKFFILGTRSTIGVTSFPWNHPSLAVYTALTDGRGETAVKVRIVDVDEEREPVFEHETVVNFPDPTEDLEVVFLINNLVFPNRETTGCSCMKQDAFSASEVFWLLRERIPEKRTLTLFERNVMKPNNKPTVTVLVSQPIPQRLKKYRSAKLLRRPAPRPKSS